MSPATGTHAARAAQPSAGFIFTLLGFAAGFAVRPFGALVIGRLGDLVGRKYTFLVTMTIMGLSTFIVALLPGYASIGIISPVAFIACLLLQGLALRESMTPADFAAWGWRIPFLVSIVLLAVSIWIRLKLAESPAFLKMKREGTHSKAPLAEAFGRWQNLCVAILALLCGTAGQAVIWCGGQFYALFFLTQALKMDGVTANLVTATTLLIGTPGFVLFGWLADKIGRKPIILGGCLLGAALYFPLFQALT